MKKYENKRGVVFYIEKHWMDNKYYIYRENKISDNFGTVGELVNGCSYKTYEQAEQDLKDLYL